MTLSQLSELQPTAAISGFGADLLFGLQQRPRSISPKYFYDATGSQLFELICELPEYYPTRTELSILAQHAEDMAACIGPEADIIEFGAGASRKVRLLLDALESPRRFVPLDISGEHLQAAAQRLRDDYPGLRVEPLVGDFTQGLALPPAQGRRVGFFPGSSIGNFEPQEALQLLRYMAGELASGGLLIGVDLVKAPAVLHAAYNDAAGVTARFNKNLLARANRELGADFDLDAFDHYAYYNPVLQRIEMHLVSRARQTVRLCGERISFAEGEALHTENSYKYTAAGFQQLARNAGFEPQTVWTDPARSFSVHWLAAPVSP